MTFETLMASIRGELARSSKPADVRAFLTAYSPRDVEAGQLLIQAFDARLLRGRLCTNLADFDGHMIAQGIG